MKNTLKGTFWFCDKIPNKKSEYPTDILAWKFSLPLMYDKTIDQFLTRSKYKGTTKNENDFTMTFVRDLSVGKKVR